MSEHDLLVFCAASAGGVALAGATILAVRGETTMNRLRVWLAQYYLDLVYALATGGVAWGLRASPWPWTAFVVAGGLVIAWVLISARAPADPDGGPETRPGAPR